MAEKLASVAARVAAEKIIDYFGKKGGTSWRATLADLELEKEDVIRCIAESYADLVRERDELLAREEKCLDELKKHLKQCPEETVLGGIRNLAQVAIGFVEASDQLEAAESRNRELVAALEAVWAGVPDVVRNHIDKFSPTAVFRMPILVGAIDKMRAALIKSP